MRAFFRATAGAIAGLSIVALAISCLVLIALMVLHPDLLTRFENVWKFLAGLVPGGAVVVFVTRRVKARLAQTGDNLSNALSGWLAGEWLILLLVWGFIAVEVTVLSYLAPVYALRIDVVGSGPDLRQAGLEITADSGGDAFQELAATDTHAVFGTSRTYRWGQPAGGTVRARGYRDLHFPGAWPGLAPLHLLGAIPLGRHRLQALEVQLTVAVSPPDADIHIVGAISRQGRGTLVVMVPVDSPVTISATAPGHSEERPVLVMRHDTTVTLVLTARPGTLIVTARNLGGSPVDDLDVLINGMNWGKRLGQRLSLSPGQYTIRVRGERPDHRIIGGPVVRDIAAMETTRVTIITAVESLP